jgi:integrase
LINIKDSWLAIRKAAGLADVRIHDLRHTFASLGVSAGMSLPLIGALLGHTSTQTTARYAHLASDPMIAAAGAIGIKIAEAIGRKRVAKS